jgi:predicted amidohydrolase
VQRYIRFILKHAEGLVKTLVAVAQMTSTSDKAKNLSICEQIIKKAAARDVKLLTLPENCAFFGHGQQEVLAQAESIEGPTVREFRRLAKKYEIYLSIGGIQELISNQKKIYNTHLLINSQGEISASYKKMHLFCANLADARHNEAALVEAGVAIILAETPFFRLGLSICYDLRFGHLYNNLRKQGAEVLLIPAAFTWLTGAAHWEVLLRARAIETQTYVLAAAQIGQNTSQRRTYGHAMIVDPWGTIIAQCGDTQDLAIAEIDLEYLHTIRAHMPLNLHCGH